MAVVIASNIASVKAQRDVADYTTRYAKTIEQLSSGQRIVSAADDAAGLAVAAGLESNARVYTQGLRNVNDAIGLLNIAESALDELTAIVTRISELAEQSANGTCTTEQRSVLDEEAQVLVQELSRITDSTTYNSKDLFDGSFSAQNIQLGFSGVPITIVDPLRDISTTTTYGDGTFSAITSYTDSSGVNSVSAGDLNNDGNIDAVMARYYDSLQVKLGNGDGTFTTMVSYASPANTESTFLGDYDKDGNLDVILSCHTAVMFYHGQGDGSFSAAQTVFTKSGILTSGQQVTGGDINNDGNLDIVTAGRENNILIALGNGNGTFGTPASYGFGGTAPSGPTLADLDNDSDLDLIVAGFSSSSVYIALGNGNGTFAAATGYAAGVKPRATAAADINGDGILDLLSHSAPTGTAGILYTRLGAGNGTFGSAVTYTLPVSTDTLPTNGQTVVATDFNGDGATDVAVVADYNMALFLNGSYRVTFV